MNNLVNVRHSVTCGNNRCIYVNTVQFDYNTIQLEYSINNIYIQYEINTILLY